MNASERFESGFPRIDAHKVGRLASGMARRHDLWADVEFVRGEGARLWDVQGKDWIDLCSSFSVANFGYNHRRFRDVFVEQASALAQLTGQINALQRELADLLSTYVGADIPDCRVVLHTTGARAVETAVRAALTVRPGAVVSLWPGFHGNSIGTARLSHAESIDVTSAMPMRVLEPPYSSSAGQDEANRTMDDAWHERLQRQVAELLDRHSDGIAAIVIDPALSTRGWLLPPASFGRWLRQQTREHGIVLIADEIQSGLGRCGDWLLSRQQQWSADVLVIGKSLGGGLFPVSATLAPSSMLERLPAEAAKETFGGAALGCRLACEVIRFLAEPRNGIFERAAQIGATLREHLTCWMSETETRIGGAAPRASVAGHGAVCTIEFGAPFVARSAQDCRAARAALTLAQACRNAYLRVHLTGPGRTRIALLPPLTMTDEELGCCLERLMAACDLFAARAASIHPN